MKKLLFLYLGIFLLSPVSAQDISKKYSSMTGAEGNVYFIHPNKGFKSPEIKDQLEYDITYVTSGDSVTFNFTFYNDQASPVDSIGIISENQPAFFPAGMIYLDAHKKDNWKHRVTSRIPYDYIVTLYNQSYPYQIEVFSKGNKFTFEMKEKEWEKQSKVIKKIFDVIDLNK